MMNQKDPIETFISEHRKELDGAETPPGVWGRVEPALGNTGGGKLLSLISRQGWKAAAVLLLILGATYRFIPASAGTSGDPAELTDLEHYYDQQLATKLSSLQPGGKVTVAMLMAQQQQDSTFIQLREAFRENPGNARVRDACCQYFQDKLDLADQLALSVRFSIKPIETR